MTLLSRRDARLIRFVGCLLALPILTAAAADYAFSHLAGPLGGPGNADGPATIARFNSPNALARDPVGNLYVSDPGNRAIRKITPTGQVSTLALTLGDGGLVNVGYSGLAIDTAGNLYVTYSNSSQHKVFKITPGGTISLLAGSAYGPYWVVNKPIGLNIDAKGAAAAFYQPGGLAFDHAGNLIVADTGNNTVRRIAPDGTVTTVAGAPGGGPDTAGYVDGSATTARFTRPSSVAVDSAGNILVADFTTIRRIAPDGTVTTIAGSGGQTGSTDGPGLTARFQQPYITIDATNTVFIADSSGTIRKMTPDGIVTTIAGLAGQKGIADGTGSVARFISPCALLPASDGAVLVADRESDAIRKVTLGGTVTPFAGVAGDFGAVGGTGPEARFNQPWGAAFDRDGNAYIADRGNNLLRRISPAGVVTAAAHMNDVKTHEPVGVAIDRQGNLFVVCARNTIVMVSPSSWLPTTFAGKDLTFGRNDGPGATATFNYPLGITIGPDDTLYVADTGNKCIRTITPQGMVSTLTITSADIPLAAPNGIAIDAAGNLYVADRTLSTIHKITPAGVMTVLAGAAYQTGSTDGVGAAARFNGPCGIAVDASGNLFVTDTGSNLIRMITPTGAVTTIGGTFGIYGSADGTGAAAHFFAPLGIAIKGDALLITEELNSAIRLGRPLAMPVILSQPGSKTVTTGATVTFTVSAAGYPSPTYQWYFNNVAISGATAATLTLANVTSANAGGYTVAITNSLGSVISQQAALNVNATPPPVPPSGGGGGGGGGAPSTWFVAALLLLGITRRFWGR